jgi:hypothetical protein
MAAACPPTRFVAGSVYGVLSLRAAIDANDERWGFTGDVKRDID